MISEVCERVRLELSRRKFPHAVVYGPERAKRDGFQERIVFERDRSQGDGIVPPPTGRKSQTNPVTPYARRVRGEVRVYTRSSRPGARPEHHEQECDRVCDGVLTALYRTCKGFFLEIHESRLMRDEEWNGVEQWAGCVAVIRFSALTQIREVDYTGAGPLTAEILAVELVAVESPGFDDPFDPTPPPPEPPEDP